MDNYLDLHATFKFNISLNLARNQMDFKPNGCLIINGYEIKIIKRFAKYSSKKIRNIYLNEKDENENIIKISIKEDNEMNNYLLTKENLYFLQAFFCMKTIDITKNNFEFLRFISEELEICLLSNALDIYEESIKDNFSSSLESFKILTEDDHIQDLFEKYLVENDTNNIKQQIIDLHIESHYLYQLVTNFCISHPKNIDKLVLLIKEMDQTKGFSDYLISVVDSNSLFLKEKQNLLKIVNNEDQKKSEQSTINVILQSIRDDNVDEFQRITSPFPSFDYNMNIHENILSESIPVNEISMFTNISELFGEKSDNNFVNYLDYSAFFGSIKIFKFLLMKKVKVNQFIACFAVAGGNSEIIHLCEQNKCNFRNALKIAIIYKRDELIDWLIDTINIDKFEDFIDDAILFHVNNLVLQYIISNNHEKMIQNLIIKSIIHDNYQMFLFLNDVEKIDLRLKFGKSKSNFFSLFSNYNNLQFYEFLFNKVDASSLLEDKDIYGLTPVHYAAKNGNLTLLKYFIHKKVSMNQLAYDDLTPLHFACMNGQYEIVEYIISQPNINVNCLDRYKQTPLSISCVTNNSNTLKIIELLLKNPFVKCNYVDVNNKTILLNTIENGTDEAAIKLINSIKDISVNKSGVNFNPLCLACKLNKIEIVRSLINRNDINVNEQANCGIFVLFFSFFTPSFRRFKFNSNC